MDKTFALELIGGRRVGVAGLGNLGSSLARALLRGGLSRDRLLASHGGSEASRARAEACGLAQNIVSTDELFSSCDVILLSARPQQLGSLAGLRPRDGATLVSVMASVSLATLRGLFGPRAVRSMTSAPESIDEGTAIAGYYPDDEIAAALYAICGHFAVSASEADLSAATVGVCIPPIMENFDLPLSDVLAALKELEPRYPIFASIAWWLEELKIERTTGAAASLAATATKGGITEAIVSALSAGAPIGQALEAGFAREAELAKATAKI